MREDISGHTKECFFDRLASLPAKSPAAMVRRGNVALEAVGIPV